MRIHHLDCGSHYPIGGHFLDGTRTGLFAHLCTHCLLIELGEGLVLVDTGYGLQDVRQLSRRLGRLWPLLLNPQFREEDTALRQVEALGHSARDVRHIILTHLDFDHASGIADFPEATVHLLAAEWQAAQRSLCGLVGSQRYRPLIWNGVQHWRTYPSGGEAWFGFDAVRDLHGLPPELLLILLAGHTLGHAGVAIRTSSGWMLHAGDAYLSAGQLATWPEMPPGLAVYERIMMADPPSARRNLSRLRDLHQERQSDLTIFSSHDTAALMALQSRI